MSERRGFGAVFSDGFVRMAQQIAERKGLPFEQVNYYTIQTKGMTLSSYDPRPYKGGALEVGTSTRGADHLRGLPTLEVFAHWYRGKRTEIIADLDVPEPHVDKWLELDLLNRDKYEGKAHMVKYYQDQCTTADALEDLQVHHLVEAGNRAEPHVPAGLCPDRSRPDVAGHARRRRAGLHHRIRDAAPAGAGPKGRPAAGALFRRGVAHGRGARPRQVPAHAG